METLDEKRQSHWQLAVALSRSHRFPDPITLLGELCSWLITAHAELRHRRAYLELFLKTHGFKDVHRARPGQGFLERTA